MKYFIKYQKNIIIIILFKDCWRYRKFFNMTWEFGFSTVFYTLEISYLISFIGEVVLKLLKKIIQIVLIEKL